MYKNMRHCGYLDILDDLLHSYNNVHYRVMFDVATFTAVLLKVLVIHGQ